MLKSFLLFLLLAIGQATLAQIKGMVLDKATGKPIPYAGIWLNNEDKGTTSEPDGTFQLKTPDPANKTLVVSAAGYENALVAAGPDLRLLLNPSPPPVPKTAARRQLPSRKKVVGPFRRSDIKGNFYGNDGTPYVLARFYPYDSSYAHTPVLAAVTLYTWSKLPEATFQLRLFAARDNGEPGENLLPERVVVTVAKGQKLTTVDLSQYQLLMPAQGLFIGFEWLVVESNRREFSYTRPGGKAKHKGISYEPDLGILHEGGSERWMYIRGTWRKSSDQKKQVNTKLPFELTLTN
jgi:hypothetical protein